MKASAEAELIFTNFIRRSSQGDFVISEAVSPVKAEPGPAAAGHVHGDALAMLAHDLRGALTGVMGGVIQLGRLDLGSDARRQIDQISAAAATLNAMVGILIGEGPRGGAPGEAGIVYLPGLVAHLRARWTGAAEDKGARLDIACGPDLPARLRVDNLQLIRALGNLIGNAITHGGDGLSEHVVHVAIAQDPAGDLEFCVLDNGPGLDTAALAEELSRGMTRSPGAEPPLHGLGLHIVKDLTEAMGGRLEIETPEVGGLAVIIRFPAALTMAGPTGSMADPSGAMADPSGAMADPSGAMDDPSGTPDLPGARAAGPAEAPRDLAGTRVLLAEDNPTNQLVASRMLQALRAEVVVASDGVEALETFERETFDLLLVDIEMPRLSGLDVIRAIRGRPDERAGVPIVALTAYAMRDHRTQISDVGATGLISKPITSIDAFGAELLAYLDASHTPGTGPAAGCDPVINAETYGTLRRTMGPDTMGELLGMVINDLGSVRVSLLTAQDPPERMAIRAASHILVAVAGAIGATQLQTRAQDLNGAARGDDDAVLSRCLAICLGEIEAVIRFAENEKASGA